MSTFQDLFHEKCTPVLDEQFGVPVTLTHGEWITDEFTATWQDLNYQITDDGDFVTTFQSRDFTFPITAATFLESQFEPRKGDRITMTENGVDAVYEIQPVGNLPVKELLPGGYRWKVHTKRVS